VSLEGIQARILAEQVPRSSSPPFKWHWPHIRLFVDMASLLLAVTAIVYAHIQRNDSENLLTKSTAVQENTQRLVAGMTTRYVAPFPASMDTIAAMIRTTCAQLDVMVDVPGYGHYSSPELFHQYANALEETAAVDLTHRLKSPDCIAKGLGSGSPKSHPKIRLVLFSPEDRFASSASQFGDISRDLVNDKDGSETNKFIHFFELHRDLITSDPESLLNEVKGGSKAAYFRQLMLDRHCIFEREFRNSGAQIRYSTQQFITRVWIVDQKEAAFSFDHKNVTETAFRTADKDLVRNFNEIFASWWKDSIPYSTYWKLRRTDLNYKLAEMPRGGDSDDPVDYGKVDSCELFDQLRFQNAAR
jgi:hypothetical protein